MDLNGDGLCSVSWMRQGAKSPEVVTAGLPLAWPLDGAAAEELRWYLEDYLVAPFAVWQDRGPAIQARIQEWGQAVFNAVFAPGQARRAFEQAETGDAELVIRSDVPEMLGLPWELIRGPGGPAALRLAGFSRTLHSGDLLEGERAPGGRLRILTIISRPSGASDVGYQMVARPLLERLAAVRGQVDLVVLRPPTLDSLYQALADAAADGRPFQVVHFDGHGALLGRRRPGTAGLAGRLGIPDGRASDGVLAFEAADGGSDLVRASAFAAVLHAAKVPVVVLNACESGAVGKDLEAAIATKLLREGCAAVVAMAYRVHAVAAAEFMAVLFERLFAGDSVCAAVTAGRRRLAAQPGRPSPKGDLPLEDWLVPVHYFTRDVAFPAYRISRPAGAPPPDEVHSGRHSPDSADEHGGDLEAAAGVFLGRDALLYELDAAARLHKVVVVHGPGGTGKTELAKAFGRWTRDTGGVDDPAWVIWQSFEPGIATFGLESVLADIGMRVIGTGFARLGQDGRRQAIERLLAERRLLLIWDNFESVHTMPDPARATSPLDDAGCEEIRRFLGQVADGRSAVIMTSRSPEEWLGAARRIETGGLAPEAAAQYAGLLLAPSPTAAKRRRDRAFGELLEWLDGHPLAMRLTLPRLDARRPAELLAELQGTTPLPSEDGEPAGRHTSLPASLTYSYVHLSSRTRELLPAISLFRGIADTGVLDAFSQAADAPTPFAGVERQEWEQVLSDAARVGLVTGLGAGMYHVDPALPGYLAAAWRAADPSGYDAARDRADRAMVVACAALGAWLHQQAESGDAAYALAITRLLSRTLGAALGSALDHCKWAEALAITASLDRYWTADGLNSEAAQWADRICDAARNPSGHPPALETPAGALWLYTSRDQANRQLRAMHLDEAEDTYKQHLSMLRALPASREQLIHLGVTYHQLGRVAQQRGDLDQAGSWFQQAMTLSWQCGDQPGVAAAAHELGIIARNRGELGRAGSLFQQALAISRQLGDQPSIATTCQQLGLLARKRGDLDQAEAWYRQSLTISQQLGDQPSIAATSHELGTIARNRGDLDQAEAWYRQSLIIDERLGNRRGVAITL